jgi:hypothetical protein
MHITAMLDGDDPRRYRVVGQTTKRLLPTLGERLMILDHPARRGQEPYAATVTAIAVSDGLPTYSLATAEKETPA